MKHINLKFKKSQPPTLSELMRAHKSIRTAREHLGKIYIGDEKLPLTMGVKDKINTQLDTQLRTLLWDLDALVGLARDVK